MGLPENTGVWTNPFLGNRRLLADFSILVLAWHPILAWHPLLARASTSGSSVSIFFKLQHPFHVHVFSAMDVLLDPQLPPPGRSQIREA